MSVRSTAQSFLLPAFTNLLLPVSLACARSENDSDDPVDALATGEEGEAPVTV